MSAVDKAFKNIPRKNFLPTDEIDMADEDHPLPIGYGQTNSQPTTVRLMLEWLDVQSGQKILDVGSGSGWTTGLLSYLVGPEGNVVAVERIPELVRFGRERLNQFKIQNAEVLELQEKIGCAKSAPFDRILVSAAGEEIPDELLEQLNSPGKLVIPIRHDILELTKDTEGNISKKTHPGFVFVPLII